MTEIPILVRYGGVWDKNGYYEGGMLKGMAVTKDISYKRLVIQLYNLAEMNPKEFRITVKCSYGIRVENDRAPPPLVLTSDSDLHFYLLTSNLLSTPLYVTFHPTTHRNSISGSNEFDKDRPTVNDVVDLPTHEPCDDVPDVPIHEPNDRNNLFGCSYNMPFDSYDAQCDSVGLETTQFEHRSTNPSMPSIDPSSGSKGKNGPHKRLKGVWSEESSTRDELEVGQIFYSKRDLSMKLNVMGIKHNFQFAVKKSTKSVLYVKCIDDHCKWRLRAIKLKDSDIFKISKYVKVHSCSVDILNHDHRQAKAWVVGQLIKSKYKVVGRHYKPRDIIDDMRTDYGINMSYEKAWRARENAYEYVRGCPEQSYNQLPKYCEALKVANPGTVYHIEIEDGRFFKYLFLALGPCVRGFVKCIRPVVAMDGTFLKNKFRGQLIVAVCLDGNNQIYPLAFGVVDRETDDSIKWFLEKLKEAIGDVEHLGFVTDRNSSFSKGITAVFPNAYHGLCVQHLTRNLHDKFNNDTVENLFYVASRAYRQSEFGEAWTRLMQHPSGAGKYLDDVCVQKWSRSHCPGRRYSVMTTNIAESMNAVLKEARELPITAFVEHIRSLLQRWFWERREDSAKTTSTLTQWAESIIHLSQEQSLRLKVDPIDCYNFQVRGLEKDEVVNLHTRECTCKEFEIEQLPCAHAIAAARDRGINVYSLCAHYYTNDCLLTAYAEPIFPVGLEAEWKTSDDYISVNCLPPKVVKRVGRPKKKRILSIGEDPPNKHKCGRCNQYGHNRLTCTNPISFNDKLL